MNKTLLFVATAFAVLVSCEKNQEPANENTTSEVKGIPMTLTANIAGATKTSYADNGSGLKETWNAEESISIVTLDGDNGNIVSVDTFTSSGEAGRSSATFSGTFTGGGSPVKVIAIYPALTMSGGMYRTPPYKDRYGNNARILYNGSGNNFQYSQNNEVKQTANADFGHLSNYCLMSGAVDIDDIKNGTLTVSLSNLMTILKIVVTLPASYKGKTFSKIQMNCYTDGATDFNMFAEGGGKELIDQVASPISGRDKDPFSSRILWGDFVIPDTGVVTLYMPFVIAESSIKSGYYWIFTAFVDGVQAGSDVTIKTFTKDVTLQRGYMYTANVVVPE